MIPVSRTIGVDQLVDEMVFKFTHTVVMDWMLPGLAPTGKRIEVDLVVVMQFRGDKLSVRADLLGSGDGAAADWVVA